MKKFLLITLLFVPSFIFAQQAFNFSDEQGRNATILFSGANLFVQQGGIIKTFNLQNSYNMYNWVSADGCALVFSADMLSFKLYVGENSYLFKMNVAAQGSYQYSSPPATGSSPSTQNVQTTRRCGYCNGTGECYLCNSQGQSKACVSNMFGANCTDPYCIRKNHRCKNCGGNHICQSCKGKGYK